jgi:hypothetical protein
MKTYKVQHNQTVMVVKANNKMEAIEQVVNQVAVYDIPAEQTEEKSYTQTITRNRFGTYNVRRAIKSPFRERYGVQKTYEVWGAEEVEAPAVAEVSPTEQIISSYTWFQKELNGKRYTYFGNALTGEGNWHIEDVA